MLRFADILPALSKQVEDSLRKNENAGLADQIPAASLLRWTYDPSVDAGFIYFEAGRPSNPIERNVIKPFYSHSVVLEDVTGMVVVDVDKLGRVTGIELLWRADVFDELARKLPQSA